MRNAYLHFSILHRYDNVFGLSFELFVNFLISSTILPYSVVMLGS